MRPACHAPDFDLAKGSSLDGFDSVVFVQTILKNQRVIMKMILIERESTKDQSLKR